MTEPEIQLENFLEYFKERINFVNGNCLERIEGTILLTSYIDSLGGYRFNDMSSKQRFLKFLIECTDQAEAWKKVSLILLRQFLERKSHPFYNELISVLNKLGARKFDFTNLDHNPDISYDELILECQKTLTSEQIKILGSDIVKFKYSEILWSAYRNASVHKTAINMNLAMNIANKEVPFYSNEHIIKDGKIDGTYTRFNIPPQFIVKTLESGIETLQRDYIAGVFKFQSSDKLSDSKEKEIVSKPKGFKEDKQYRVLILKPCRPLLTDIGYLIEQSKISHEKFKETELDEDRKKEAAMSRSAILMSVHSLESLVNCLHSDFSTMKIQQLPDSLQKNLIQLRIYLINYHY